MPTQEMLSLAVLIFDWHFIYSFSSYKKCIKEENENKRYFSGTTALHSSEVQFRSGQQDSTPPSWPTPSRFARPTSAPSSSSSDVSLVDIMAQLQRMDTHLDTFSIELYQVNVRVGCIARRQETMGEFALDATPSPPPPVASDSEDEDDDDGDDDDDDGDARSIDEMST